MIRSKARPAPQMRRSEPCSSASAMSVRHVWEPSAIASPFVPPCLKRQTLKAGMLTRALSRGSEIAENALASMSSALPRECSASNQRGARYGSDATAASFGSKGPPREGPARRHVRGEGVRDNLVGLEHWCALLHTKSCIPPSQCILKRLTCSSSLVSAAWALGKLVAAKVLPSLVNTA